jgi:hypothetical protein
MSPTFALLIVRNEGHAKKDFNLHPPEMQEQAVNFSQPNHT